MKYAIPVSGGALSPHFGHCEHFALFDIDEASKEVIKKELIASPAHEPGLLPVFRWLLPVVWARGRKPFSRRTALRSWLM